MSGTEHSPAMEPKETIAHCCRVLHALGLVDLRGWVSSRETSTSVDGYLHERSGESKFDANDSLLNQSIVFGPVVSRGRDRAARSDVVMLPLHAVDEVRNRQIVLEPYSMHDSIRKRIEGELALHAAIYRHRPDVGGIVHVHPPWTMAFAIADVPLLPVTHQESDLALQPTPNWGRGNIPMTEAERGDFLDRLGRNNFCQLPGEGVIVVGPSPRAATVRAHYLELLARNSYMTRTMAERLPGGEERIAFINAKDVEKHLAERPDWDHFWGYYRSLDPVYRSVDATPSPITSSSGLLRRQLEEVVAVPEAERDDAYEERLARIKLSLACRILYRYGLNAYLEHVSVRLGDKEQFLINPLADLSAMQPEHMATVNFESNWLAGPYRPPGHKWLHAEIFKMRPDVRAIVHTHQPLARIFAVLGERVLPVQAPGAAWARAEAPIHPSPDLLFDRERAQAVVRVLGQHVVVHQRGHGIEYIAEHLEDAVVGALAVERHCQLAYMAMQLRRSNDGLIFVDDDAWDFPAGDWWNYFVDQCDGHVPAWACPYPLHW